MWRHLFLSGLAFALAGTLLVSCSSSKVTAPSGSKDGPASGEVAYSMIFVVHGDANYTFHKPNGLSRQADITVLQKAHKLAQKAKKGEVFIFHQRPEKKILWLFPRKDRRAYYYRNGQLVHKNKYSPTLTDSLFSAESNFYRNYSSLKDNKRDARFFLFFGHEIPENNRSRYYQSIPKLTFGIDRLSSAMNSFLRDSSRYNLTVLSTCNNGTPKVVERLLPLTKYLLASPQNLHLSHIRLEKLSMLEQDSVSNSKALADSIAQDTYDTLTESLQTAITLSVYSMVKIRPYIGGLAADYSSYLEKNTEELLTRKTNIDCRDLGFLDKYPFINGVTSWYQPASFGRSKNKTSHSGWGCKGEQY